MKPLLSLAFFLCLFQITWAQDYIEPEGGSGLDNLFGDGPTVLIRVLSQTDETLNIEVKYENFTEAAEYIIRGQILNSRKKSIKEFKPAKRKIGKGDGSIDLSFQMTVLSDKTYKEPYLSSSLIKIMIYDAKDDDDVIEIPGSEPIILSGTSHNFKVEKKWRVGGGSGVLETMVIPITLTPIGKAKNIGIKKY